MQAHYLISLCSLQHPHLISSKKYKRSNTTQRDSLVASQRVDVTEAEDGSDGIVEIKLPSGQGKHVHSELSMEEPLYDDTGAAGLSQADVEMTEVYIEHRQEQNNPIEDVAGSHASPPAAVSNGIENDSILTEEIDKNVSVKDESRRDYVNTTEQPVLTFEIPTDHTNAAVTREDNTISSLNEHNKDITSSTQEKQDDEKDPSSEIQASQQSKNEISETTSSPHIVSEVTNPPQSPTDIYFKPCSPPVSNVLYDECSTTSRDIVEGDNTIEGNSTFAITLIDDSENIMNESFPMASSTMLMSDDRDSEDFGNGHTEHTASNEDDQIIISEHDVITWKDQGQGIN